MDFIGPDVEPEELQEAARRRRKAILWATSNGIKRVLGKGKRQLDEEDQHTSTINEESPDLRFKESKDRLDELPVITTPAPRTNKSVSFDDTTTSILPHFEVGTGSSPSSPTTTEKGLFQPRITSPASTVVGSDPDMHGLVVPTTRAPSPPLSSPAPPPLQPRNATRFQNRIKMLRTFLTSLCSPPSITILISIAVSLIQPLKALFSVVPPHTPHPRWQPPHWLYCSTPPPSSAGCRSQ